jgi:uncharacterized protein (TIGR00369 family)
MRKRKTVQFDQAFINQVNQNPLYTVLGIQVEEVKTGHAHAVLRPKPDVCWPFPKQPHGGILFTLMDTTMAWAVISQLDSGYNCTTVHMGVQYTAPATTDHFICHAWTTHRTGRMSYVRADIHNPHKQLLATAQATFRIIRSDLFKQPDFNPTD